MLKVVFLCKGTVGDVHPLLSLAYGYKKLHAGDEVVFACAPSSLSGIESAVADHGIKLFHLPDSVGSIPLQDSETAQKLSSDEERLSALKTEAASCLQASQGADFIIFNLFSLEGYFIAKHLGIPCIAASPHVMARTPPCGFEAKLKEAYPILHQKLKSAGQGQVSYVEVEHWMWRLFLDDFGQVCRDLGLPSLPLSPSPQTALPAPTPLLYGVSSVVLPRQPYWPKSVSLCGYWILPPALQLPPDPALASVIEATSLPLLYVGFGSMERFMFDTNWEEVFEVLESALEATSMEAIFQCTQGGLISQTYSTLKHHPKRVYLWTKPIPHLWLFEKCSAILHHGGSGTVASALLTRKPQIICPVMFDQMFWAEHLSWEGLAYQCCSHMKQLTAGELTHALKVVHGVAMKKHIEDIGTQLSKENGLQVALTEIHKIFKQTPT